MMISYQAVASKYQSGSSSFRALLSFCFCEYLYAASNKASALASWRQCFVCMTTSKDSRVLTVITMQSLLCDTWLPFMRLHLQHPGLQRQVIDDQLDGRLQTCRQVSDIDKVGVFSGVFPLPENVLRIDIHRLTDSQFT